MNLVHGLLCHRSLIPVGRVVRASDRFAEGQRFDSCLELRFFLCPTLMT